MPVRRMDERGTAVVEFALAAPLLLGLMSGITTYGGFFWMSHSLQQAANDAARAAVAGVTVAERQTIATDVVTGNLRRGTSLDPARAVVTVQEAAEMVTVSIRYDATGNPLFRMPFVPMPSPTIRRVAVIRMSPL